MFHPMVAGVTIPGIALGLLAITPYIDKNPSNKPDDRKFAITMMTMFLMMWAVLVIIGSFFRGQGFNFVFPWNKRHLLRAVGARRLVVAIPIIVILRRRRRHASSCSRTASARGDGRAVARDAQARRERADAGRRRAEPSTSTELEADRPRARRRDARDATSDVPAVRRRGDVVEWEPVDEEELGVTRRQFLNRGLLTAVGLLASPASAPRASASCGPPASGGFGGKVNAGKLDDILADIDDEARAVLRARGARVRRAVPERRPARTPKKVYSPVDRTRAWRQGIVALYQRCVHLGCRVPWCQTSQWFECPCHGSKYNRVGEKKAGPAPRGLDRFRDRSRRRQRSSINTGDHRHRSADRHQHDRSAAGRPAVRLTPGRASVDRG